MGLDYALVHLKFTIPPAITLTLLLWPAFTRLDAYKVLFLILIAVLSTIPWDSYLIQRRIWTYPSNVILGPTLLAIPAEELFFFVIQTYTTSLLYLLINKPIFHPSYLRKPSASGARSQVLYRTAGQLLIGLGILWGWIAVKEGKERTYIGLILVWACPFMLLLWTLAHRLIIALPLISTALPISVPTVYLWMVDTLALKRGTWSIESGTKLGIHLWDGLEIEEAAFFLATNALIVLGLLAFDNALAVLQAFPSNCSRLPPLPSPILLVQALLRDSRSYDGCRIEGLTQAVARLKRKSRSFYLASAFFEGRLRIDLVLLYSFCRVADDMIDNAPTSSEAKGNLAKLQRFLDIAYSTTQCGLAEYVASSFPPETQQALLQLPVQYMSSEPLYSLLMGFETDLTFPQKSHSRETHQDWPIVSGRDLTVYAARVAGTIAELCIELVLHHYPKPMTGIQRQRLLSAGNQMGIALQLVNIARDIKVDAAMERVYIPTDWLKDEELSAAHVLRCPEGSQIDSLRKRLLDQANEIYVGARPAIEELPLEARGPMRVAVESYMEIGRVLREKNQTIKAGRATVPIMRRLRVGWKALKAG